MERGKVEPNENRDSYQSAEIDIYKLSLARGFGDLSFGKDHFLRFDYSRFTSGKEQVGSQVFYEKDTGNVATFIYGFNFVHELSYSAGVYLSVSPLTDYNKEKFSTPRVDLWSIGLKSGLEINSSWFLEGLLHYGSGIPGQQNSYVAFTQLVGLKLAETIAFPLTLKFGPYAELDMQDRNDSKYDTAFSAPGRTDRIRSMKIGTVSSLDAEISRNWYVSAGYVQKLGGYDAPATNATFASLGVKF
ncbi:MAG: hypothetical protein HC902_00940 [Calothrix sp. SM1_5_4]|nr:hypothetical protein [Calothrix sp. SM1_5_4]